MDSDRYPKLGKWVRRQRQAYRNEQWIARGCIVLDNNRIGKDHVVALEGVGFEWEVRGKPILKIDPSEFEGMII